MHERNTMHEEAMAARRRTWKEMSTGKKILLISKRTAIVAAVLILVSVAVMLLWNWIMSRTLGLPSLDFWEALGLFILAKILFGGHGGSPFARMRMRRVMREHMARQDEDEEEEEHPNS